MIRALRNKTTGEWMPDEDRGNIPYIVGDESLTLEIIDSWGWWEYPSNKGCSRINILNDYELVEVEIVVKEKNK